MVATASSIHPSTFAVSYETTFANAPADDASTWAADEGTTADRLYHLEVDPAFIRQAAVVDARLTDRIFKKAVLDPLKGLRNAEGGSVVLVLHGSESATTAASAVTETGHMRLLEHCLGGLSLGYSSALTGVTTNTSFTLTTATGVDEGVMYALEDADDTGRLFPVRVLTDAGAGAITTDRDLPFTLATADTAHAVALAYIDQDALSNPADANASTVSVLVVKGGKVWELTGAALQLDSIDFPRGEAPRFTCSISGAYSRPPDDGAPAEPTWTGTVQGGQGLVVGADTKLHVQSKGTVTEALFDIVSASLQVGVPRTPMDTVTETTARAQGRAGYTTAPSDTVLEVQAYMAAGFQNNWDTTQSLVVTFYQVAPAGSGWVIHGSDAVLMEPPERVAGNESNLYTLRFEFREDASLDATATNLDRSRSKLLVGLY